MALESTRKMACLSRVGRWITAFVLSSMTFAATSAEELLSGRIVEDQGAVLVFRLVGESRENVVGGTIELGSNRYEITHVSRAGLIGASRFGTDASRSPYGEFAVFSSSFSSRTAIGQPWVAGRHYSGCGSPYNSFVAVYRVEGERATDDLGRVPYPNLVENVASSQTSQVYCFVSMPPAKIW